MVLGSAVWLWELLVVSLSLMWGWGLKLVLNSISGSDVVVNCVQHCQPSCLSSILNLKGSPLQVLKHSGGAGHSSILLHDEMCCLMLDGLNVVNIFMGVWVPDSTPCSVYYTHTQELDEHMTCTCTVVGCLLNLPGADLQVSPEEAEMLAFVHTLLMCSLQFMALLIVTPKYLALLTVSSMCPCSSYWCSRGFQLWVAGSEVHFPGWKAISHLFSHSASCLRSCSSCSWVWSSGQVTILYAAVSSAKSRVCTVKVLALWLLIIMPLCVYLLLSFKNQASVALVVWSLLWFQCHAKNKQIVKRVKNIDMELGSWAWGYRLQRLPPSWFQNDWSEVAGVMAVGRWYH